MDVPYALDRGGFVLVRTREPTLGIGFREPFDSVLRRLEASYLNAAWDNVAATLADFGLDPNACQWGECHPGLLDPIDGSTREDSPIAGAGWLLTESDVGPLATADAVLPPWPELDAVLAGQDPPLIILYDDYRARRATRGREPIDPSDTSIGLACLLAMMAEDVTDWRGRPTVDGSPWLRAANAIARGDATAFAGALTDAQEQYTRAGARLCLEGFGGFLLQRTNTEGPATTD